MLNKACNIDVCTVTVMLHSGTQADDKQDRSTPQQVIECSIYTRYQTPYCPVNPALASLQLLLHQCQEPKYTGNTNCTLNYNGQLHASTTPMQMAITIELIHNYKLVKDMITI